MIFSFAQGKEVKLKWKVIEGAKKYNLEVASDQDFNKKILEKTVEKNSYPTEMRSGIYYLRVQGIDVLGRPGQWSKSFRLAVTAPIKPSEDVVDNKKITFFKNAPKVESSWKSADRATSY